MKLVIIGGVAGGASAAARARRLSEDAEIVMFERGEHISFANCGLPYHIGGVIPERDSLLVMKPEMFHGRVGADVRVRQEVVSINRDRKTVTAKRLDTGETYEEGYDALIIATGSSPLVPPIPGADDAAVIPLWTIPDMDRILASIEAGARKAVVLGAGFVGIEAAENLCERGLDVHLVDMENQVLRTMDRDMTLPLEDELSAHGIHLHLGCTAETIRRVSEEGRLTVEFREGGSAEADFVLMSVGVRPNSELAEEAGLELSAQKGIVVDGQQRTSDPSIYAVGDAVAVKDPITGDNILVPLAGPANRQGRTAADAIFGRKSTYKGSLGTHVIRVFNQTACGVGKTAAQLDRAGIAYHRAYLHPASNAKYFPGWARLHMKLLFDDEGRILGAQVVGERAVEKQIDVLATAMRAGMTVYDLEDLELAYAPPYGSAKSPINYAGMVAANVLRGDTDVVHPDETPENALFLDVRELAETELGMIPEAVVIPLGQLRQRLGELPRDRRIVVYCQVGLRGYVAERMLKQNGFDAANLGGGWLSWRQLHARTAAIPSPASAAEPTVPQAGPSSTTEPERHVDVTAMQCPGPIVRVKGELEAMTAGQILGIRGAKPFRADLQAWCGNQGHELMNVHDTEDGFEAMVRKGSGKTPGASGQAAQTESRPETASIVVFSNDLDKVMAAFIIATGLASMGTKVSMFFTFWGLSVLRKESPPNVVKDVLSKMFGIMLPRGAAKLALSKMHMMGMGTAMMKHVMAKKSVTSLPDLVQQARELGVTFIACDMAMDVMGLAREELLDEVDEVAGVASFAALAQESGTTLFI